ncbi:MAG TPA: SDR family NAD(P)-dependent oxidoreductase [Bacteroidales bacterium]|nr:SDR family NAD(P)-dependent oxidoreductase [Bacteroidales bacterium]
METELQSLIELSRFYGKNKESTLAGGGNTSFKDDNYIWIKASGEKLATIDKDGFVQLEREKVQRVNTKRYSDNMLQREMQVKQDLSAARVQPLSNKTPSVETSFHELIDYAYVVHLHPTIVNALMCAKNSKRIAGELFGEEIVCLSYAPGYALFKNILEVIEGYRNRFQKDPKLIFLENHGIFVSANSVEEVKSLYSEVIEIIKSKISYSEEFDELIKKDDVSEFLPYFRSRLSVKDSIKTIHYSHNRLHEQFYISESTFQKASGPFTIDIIAHCKSAYLFIEESDSPEHIMAEFDNKADAFYKKNGYYPSIIMVRNYGLFAVGDDAASAETNLEVYEDLLKVSYYSEAFGGPRFLGKDDIEFVNNWLSESAIENSGKAVISNPVKNKTVIITGAAQGFGEGLAMEMVKAGANVIVADLNDEKGRETANSLKQLCENNSVGFFQVDVSDPESMDALVTFAVKEYGGLDVFISNAGILFAGGLDELKPAIFKKMTEVNYNAWFYAARSASKIMKLQYNGNKQMYGDLIQINSKSGLQGSNRNFAYAGGKFGGIGLTQSFALELAPFKVKVNSVCPGNFFEGPLWSDPEKGLFVQYLNANKVPGAKSVEDVKQFYEDKVPLQRGCRAEDVMKAVIYIIDQEYETGQAIPVTGGQVMLK